MKRIISGFLSLLVSFCLVAQEKNLLGRKYSQQELKGLLIPHSNWAPFPKPDDREGWKRANLEMTGHYVREAETYLDFTWPTIPATYSLDIVRSGNRQIYEQVSFKKRTVLGTLLLGEIIENKGRFIDQIINGVWSICEESWWGSSAHLAMASFTDGLVNVDDPYIDLFSSETALLLSWTDYFLGDKLDCISPTIRKRIYNEVDHRLFKPFMNKYHWWMGQSSDGRGPNNWNPWICSNWINFVLLLEPDTDRRTLLVSKALTILDEFIDWYPQDGGCDEGPGYWGGAALRMYSAIQLLNLATGDAYQYMYETEKVKNMGRYIYRAQISDTYFLNFADADPKMGVPALPVYQYGKDINDEAMMKFAAYYRKPTPRITTNAFFMNLFELFDSRELCEVEAKLPFPKDVWLPDLQVMVARDKEGSTDGYYTAVKGGHNAEAHNHNDVGSFIVYYDGLPLLIDVGRGTYTARTFNKQRYDIWFNCSNYHNLPTINGYNQLNGIEYKASGARYTGGDNPSFFVDIAEAYPSEAGIDKWLRTVRFMRGRAVLVKDEVALSKTESVVQNLMTCYPCEVTNPGEITIGYKTQGGVGKPFRLSFDGNRMEASVEKIKPDAPEDVGVVQKWGDSIYRIRLTVKTPRKKDEYTLKITAKHE